MRRLFLLFSLFLALLIPVESFAGPFMVLHKRGSAWSKAWLTGWDYRKAFTVSRASGAVTDYQIKILVGESSGATGENVDCGGHILSTFNDLRFTTSDATTTIPYWIESITGTTPNQLATVWVKLDSVGTSATTFYMYYGKAGASAASNGANTFAFFEDYEWGDDEDDLTTSGGGVTWTAVQGTAKIDTAKSYGGTRSARFSGAATFPNYTASYSLAEGLAVHLRFWKGDKADNGPNVLIGNASKYLYVQVSSIEQIVSSVGNTGVEVTDAAWQYLSLYNINLTANTFSVTSDNGTANGLPIDTGSYNYLRLLNATTIAGGEGYDVWIDNVFIRKWVATEPVVGSWGIEEGG